MTTVEERPISERRYKSEATRPEKHGLLPNAVFLTVLRALCLASAIAAAVIFIVDTPGEFQILRTPCVDRSSGDCHSPQLTPQIVHQLHQVGLSADVFALYFVAVGFVVVTVFMVIGLLVLRSRPESPLTLVTALFLLTFGASLVGTDAVMAPGSPWRVPATILSIVASASLITFLCLFPTGSFRPRWTAGLAVLGILLTLAGTWPHAPFAGNSGFQALEAISGFVLFLGVILAQVVRYRTISSPVERQQTKVAVAGIVATTVLLGTLIGLANFGYAVQGLAGALFLNSIFELIPCLVPLSLGIAMLRYRLWDVDILINRTLVYGSLTVTLGLVYAIGVMVLSAIFRTLTGQGSEYAVAISTLTVAALFQPFRHRIQSLIDRRFYRRKYDAARTLARFSERVRDDVEIDQLRTDMLTVLQDTMQPSHVSVWLR